MNEIRNVECSPASVHHLFLLLGGEEWGREKQIHFAQKICEFVCVCVCVCVCEIRNEFTSFVAPALSLVCVTS